MKPLALLMPLFLALALVGFARADQPAAGKDAAQAAPSYTCPMHPKVQSGKPGHCPVCQMKLQAGKVAARKIESAPAAAMPGHDTAARDHSRMESTGMEDIEMGNESMDCPMCKGMKGMSMGGSAADDLAKVAKPLAPAGNQRPARRRCGGGC